MERNYFPKEKMKYFATYFDRNYLSKGLILIHSLREVGCKFKLFVLALDNETDYFFKNNIHDFQELEVITLQELEGFDERIIKAKGNRAIIEYYFTLSPFLPWFILQKYSIPHVCSLDADLVFYSDPSKYFDLLGENSIVITPHKFSKENIDKLIYGEFNVSFQIFKNDNIGISCLSDWAQQCFEWCFDYLDSENQRFADQLYLNTWQQKYGKKIYVINDQIGGLAVWNVSSYLIQEKNGCFYSNHEKLIFYHFHNFKLLNQNIAINGFSQYELKINIGIQKLYRDYFVRLISVQKKYKLLQSFGIRNNNNESILRKIFSYETVIVKIIGQYFFLNTSWIPLFLKRVVLKF
jgi:hypothetical protein